MAFWSKNLLKDVLTFSFFIRTIGGWRRKMEGAGERKAMNKSIAGFLEECKRSS
jgi:hypothetical protein